MRLVFRIGIVYFLLPTQCLLGQDLLLLKKVDTLFQNLVYSGNCIQMKSQLQYKNGNIENTSYSYYTNGINFYANLENRLVWMNEKWSVMVDEAEKQLVVSPNLHEASLESRLMEMMGGWFESVEHTIGATNGSVQIIKKSSERHILQIKTPKAYSSFEEVNIYFEPKLMRLIRMKFNYHRNSFPDLYAEGLYPVKSEINYYRLGLATCGVNVNMDSVVQFSEGFFQVSERYKSYQLYNLTSLENYDKE